MGTAKRKMHTYTHACLHTHTYTHLGKRHSQTRLRNPQMVTVKWKIHTYTHTCTHTHTYIPWEEAFSNKAPQSTDGHCQMEDTYIHTCVHTCIPWVEAFSNRTPQSTDGHCQKEDSYQELCARDRTPSCYQEAALDKNSQIQPHKLAYMSIYVYMSIDEFDCSIYVAESYTILLSRGGLGKKQSNTAT